MVLSLAACGGGGGGDAGPGAAQGEQTYAISGQVTLNGSGLANVTIALTGAANAQTTTDGAGNYTFSGRSAGTYTITATLAGHSFTPPAINVTLSNASVTGRNFTAVAGSSISGRVTENGAGLSGVTVSLTGTAEIQAQTDANGYYIFSGLANGSYTVTPSKSGYLIYLPDQIFVQSINMVVNNSNYSGQDFEAAKKYAISGRVLNNGNGLAGVSVYSGDWPFPVVTDNEGYYIFDIVLDGTYNIRVEKEGYWFIPSSQNAVVNGANATVNFEWRQNLGVKFLGATGNQYPSFLTVDASRNLYISGTAEGNFDGQASAGSNDAFILKADPNGIKAWTRLNGGAYGDQGEGNIVDNEGNVYLSGLIGKYIDFMGALTLTSDAFIGKRLSDGASEWSRTIIEGTIIIGTLNGRRMVQTNEGSIISVVYGYVASTGMMMKLASNGIDWVDITGLAVTNLAGVDRDDAGNFYVAGNNVDAVVAKLNASGSVVWTQPYGTGSADTVYDLKADAAGNVFMCGKTEGIFPDQSSMGLGDIFVAAYNASGTRVLLKQITTAGVDFAKGIAIDESGNIYITGGTTGAFTGFSNVGSDDFFLMKLNSSGETIWVKQVGTSAQDFGVSIDIDSDGTIVVLGQTSGSLGGATNPGGVDFFVVKYDANGNMR